MSVQLSGSQNRAPRSTASALSGNLLKCKFSVPDVLDEKLGVGL